MLSQRHLCGVEQIQNLHRQQAKKMAHTWSELQVLGTKSLAELKDHHQLKSGAPLLA